MKSSRLLFAAVGAFAVAGCSAILGIDGTYTVGDDGTEGGTLGDGGKLPDATVGDGGPTTDAMAISDATTLPDVVDAAPVLCADGAVSPVLAAIGSPCCAASAFSCDKGQQLELLICDNGVWSPNGACTSGNLCRFDTGEYPDGGAQNDGGIVGNGSGSGNLGTCAAEIGTCATHNPGDIVCSGGTLVVCGADLTTAYEETCVRTAASSAATLCGAHTGPHCPQCIDGKDFACTNNVPSSCSDGGWVQQPACAANQYCHADDGTCATDVCTPGHSTCVGDDLQTCDTIGDAYQDAGTCPTGTCDGPIGACDTCVKLTNYGCNAGNTSYTTCKADGTGTATTTCGGATPYCYEPNGVSSATCAQCLTASNCTGGNACTTAACGGGSCSYPPLNNGTVVVQPAPGACTETTCQAGAPTVTNLPDSTVVVQPAAGACTETTCSSGKPVVTNLTDGTVVVPPGTGCTEQVCTGGAPTTQNLPNTASCTTTDGNNSPGTCDGAGTCVAN